MTDTASPQKSIIISDAPDLDSPNLSSSKQQGGHFFKSKTPLSEHNTKGAFVTGTHVHAKSLHDKLGKTNEIYDYHDKLNGLVDQMDNKIKVLLNENQTNFLMAYKEQMMHIQKELKILKKKVDEETYKRKNNERMNILEQERDWFRAEAIRLDKVCKEQQKTLQEVKFKLKQVSEDKSYFEEFVLSAKKENKALKEELMYFEMGRRTGDDFISNEANSKNYASTGKRGHSSEGYKNNFTPQKYKFFEGTDKGSGQKNEQFNENNKEFSHNETKFLEVIKQLKTELDKEKKFVRQLRQDKAQLLGRRIELEQILVESINEVKKEISKRRSVKTYKDLNKGPQIPQEIDLSKFSATDKKNLLEYFLSNEVVLEEVYNVVFGFGSRQTIQTPSEGERTLNNPLLTNKSEGKLKYSFNYGFGSSNNIRIPSRELENVAVSRKAQTLIGELKRPDMRRTEPIKRDL